MNHISYMGTSQLPWLPYTPTLKLITPYPQLLRVAKDSKELKLHIKSMVSHRCKLIVKAELEKLGISHSIIELGSVELPRSISHVVRNELKKNLLLSGLELLDDKKSILIEKIRNVIIQMIHHSEELPSINYSKHISSTLQYDYTYLANIFSESSGITIQQFIIKQKIERVKEFISYGELNLTEIAEKLQYSSVAHLSNQFRKTTGFSPSFYKQLKYKRNVNLENI